MSIGVCTGSEDPPHVYRPTRQLSWELSQHAGVFLGSGQYIEGLNLLTNLLTAGTAISSKDANHPALVPPSQHLALVATLIVHPSLNTKSKFPDSILASNEALNYLRLVNQTAGPINARFADAFAFATSDSPLRSGKWRNLTSPDSTEDEKPIRSDLANRSSVWNRATDFWHVVGWAFNCSIKHKQRWDRWRQWLELMLDIMEDDWTACVNLQQQAVAERNVVGKDLLQQSIIMRYITAGSGSSTSRRQKIIHAILADGSPKSMNEFKEVFSNETTKRKRASPVRRILEKDIHPFDLDLDDGEDEEDDGEAGRRSARHTAPTQKSSIVLLDGSSEDDEDDIETRSKSGADRLGGIDSVRLRERLLALLVSVAEIDPQSFTTRAALFEAFVEPLRELQVASFAAFIANSLLSPMTHVMFCCKFLLICLPISPPTYDIEPPTQSDLVDHFLALPANSGSCVENAKVSILLQSILQHMLPELKATKDFIEAVDVGVKARNQRVPEKVHGSVKKRKIGACGLDEDEARHFLGMSAEFLKATSDAIARDSSRKSPQRPASTSADLSDISLANGPILSSVPSDPELNARSRKLGGPDLASSGLSSAPSEIESNARGRGLDIQRLDSSGLSSAPSSTDLDSQERELGYR